MKQKKLISLILSLIMLASLFTPFSAFANGATTIIIPTISDTAGATVDVAVSIENNPGILGATLKFEFDEALTLLNATNGEAFSALTMTKPGTLTSPCNFVWDGQELADENITDGVILTLQFKIPDDAVSGTKYNITATYTDGDIVNNYLNPISVNIINGSVEVLDFTYGDLNSDKKINTTDIIMLRRHIAGGYEQVIKEQAADVNIDSKTNSTDTILVRRYIAGGYGITLPYIPSGCNHVMEAIPAKEATEEEEGNIAYWYCKACGKYFSDEKGTTSITLEATILPILPKSEYTIQYVCDMIAPDNTTFKETDTYKPTQTKVLQDVKMDTYEFLGWSDKNGRMYGMELPEGTTGDLILYANWASLRNRAVPVSKLGKPIILEDSTEGQILFVYEIGEIQNIPLFETQDLLVADGIITSNGVVNQTSIETGNAQEVAKAVANTTTNSSAWTLSKDWNEITSVSEEWAEQQGMTTTEAEEFTKSNSNTYNMTNSSGGSSSLVNSSGSSFRLSQNEAHKDETYTEDQKYTEFDINGKLSNSTTVSAGVKVPAGPVSVEAGVENTTSFEIGADYNEKNYSKDVSTGTDSWSENIDVSSSQSSTSTSSKTWNSSQGFSSSSATSSTQAVSKAVSELISQKHSKDSTYSTGSEEEQTRQHATSNATNDSYSSSITYSNAEMTINERVFTSTGNTYGAYRLVQVGTAKVFAVVGYDIKNKTYYTYTHTILDDDVYKEYLDYSFDRSFNDYETSVLPFEIPVFVDDFVNSRITSSKLQISDDGVVKKYLGEATDEIIIIPSYYTKTNTTTGEPEMIKITGLAPGLFKDNTNIVGISLGNFVNEIPESAFEGCTSLKEVICPNVMRIGANAFKGCTSLSEFSLPDEIETIGENAFDGIPALKSNAPTKEIANIVASSNVQNITLDISKIATDDFSDMSFEIGEIETFKLLGGHKEYKGLNINSDAQNTILSGITISECDVVPIEVSSPNLTLERVTAQGDGFALILKADETTLSIEGVSSMLSESANAVIGKKINFVEINSETYSAIETNGNTLICGELNNNDGYLSDEKVVYITEEEYINYLTSRKVSFDANGGTTTTEYMMIPYNAPYGELPTASRDYYTFDGWYTTPEDTEEIQGEKITAETLMTSLVDVILYARWIQNDVSEWVLKPDMPIDGQIVNTEYRYTLTEYTTSSSSSMSGWEHYNTTSEWSAYGGWSDWSRSTQYYASDSREVQQETWSEWIDTSYNLHEYHYYHWSPKKGWYYTTRSAAANAGVGTPVFREHWLTYTLPWNKYSGGMDHYGPHSDGYLYFKADGTAGGASPFERDTWISQGYTNYYNVWRYRDRYLIYTYHFRRYLDKTSATYPTGDNISNIQEWVQYRAK